MGGWCSLDWCEIIMLLVLLFGRFEVDDLWFGVWLFGRWFVWVLVGLLELLVVLMDECVSFYYNCWDG